MATEITDNLLLKHYDLSTPESYRAALKYLDKKRQEKENRRELALIPWVVGMMAVWGIFYFMYFGG